MLARAAQSRVVLPQICERVFSPMARSAWTSLR